MRVDARNRTGALNESLLFTIPKYRSGCQSGDPIQTDSYVLGIEDRINFCWECQAERNRSYFFPFHENRLQLEAAIYSINQGALVIQVVLQEANHGLNQISNGLFSPWAKVDYVLYHLYHL